MKVAVSKEPPKRKRIWPWVLLGSFVLTVVAPIAVIYGVFYEPDTKKVELEENFDIKQFGANAIVDCMDSVPTDHKLSLSITEKQLDTVLDYALTNAGVKGQYVKKAYAKIKNNKYIFYIDLDGVVIKSRAKLTMVCDESDDKSAFVFTVTDISLGRAAGVNKLVKTLTKSVSYDTMIQNIFKDIGLSMVYNKDNMTLTYKKEDIIKDIQNFSTGGDANNDLLLQLMSVLFDNNLVNFDFNSQNFLDLSIDLERLSTNALVTDDKDHLKIKAEEITTNCKDNMLALIKNKAINPDTANLDLIFTYLMRGYVPLSDSQKDEIKTYDFSSIGIPVVESYVPVYESTFVIDPSETAIFDTMQGRIMNLEQLISEDATINKEVTLLYESDLNNYIASRDFSQGKMLMHRHDGDNYKLNYIVVDNFYCNIYKTDTEQLAELVCKVNINGYHTSLTFETNAKIENNEALTFKVKDDGISYGDVKADELNSKFFGLLASSLNTGSTGTNIEANAEQKTITIKFSGMVDKAKTSIHDTLLAKAEQQVTPAAAWPYISAKMDKAITDSINETFDETNAEIQIAGENRDVNGTLKLVLKDNDFKNKFKLKVKAEIDALDPSVKTGLLVIGFNVDSFVDKLMTA